MGGNVFSWIMGQSSPLAIVVGVLILLAWAIVAFVKMAKPVRRWLLGFGDLFGEPARPGVPARKGIIERQADTETLLHTLLDTQQDMIAVQAEHTETLRGLTANAAHPAQVTATVNINPPEGQ